MSSQPTSTQNSTTASSNATPPPSTGFAGFGLPPARSSAFRNPASETTEPLFDGTRSPFGNPHGTTHSRVDTSRPLFGDISSINAYFRTPPNLFGQNATPFPPPPSRPAFSFGQNRPESVFADFPAATGPTQRTAPADPVLDALLEALKAHLRTTAPRAPAPLFGPAPTGSPFFGPIPRPFSGERDPPPPYRERRSIASDARSVSNFLKDSNAPLDVKRAFYEILQMVTVEHPANPQRRGGARAPVDQSESRAT